MFPREILERGRLAREFKYRGLGYGRCGCRRRFKVSNLVSERIDLLLHGTKSLFILLLDLG